jgi:hypothetical protein
MASMRARTSTFRGAGCQASDGTEHDSKATAASPANVVFNRGSWLVGSVRAGLAPK